MSSRFLKFGGWGGLKIPRKKNHSEIGRGERRGGFRMTKRSPKKRFDKRYKPSRILPPPSAFAQAWHRLPWCAFVLFDKYEESPGTACRYLAAPETATAAKRQKRVLQGRAHGRLKQASLNPQKKSPVKAKSHLNLVHVIDGVVELDRLGRGLMDVVNGGYRGWRLRRVSIVGGQGTRGRAA